MKTNRINVASVLCLALIVGLFLSTCGCQPLHPTTQPSGPDPVQRLTFVVQSATFLLNAVANARDAGLLKQSDIDPYRPYVDAFVRAKLEAEKELKTGNTSAMEAAVNQVEAAYVPLQPLLAKIAAKKGTSP